MRKPPYRICIGLMIFWTSATGFVLLGQFQMSILAMVDKEYRNTTNNESNLAQENFGPRFHWTLQQEAQLISAYYYGLAVVSFPAGILTDFVGPYKTVIASNGLSAIATCVAVPVSGHNWIPLFICRFVNGLCGGFMFPSMVSLIAKWAPPKEKATFTAGILGFVLGSLVTPPIASSVIRSLNWQWSFYLTGVFTGIFCLVWSLLVSDYPQDNWFCPKEEAEFIHESMEGVVKKGWVKPPLCRMFKSIPFIVLIFGHFGVSAGMVLLTTLLPKFFDEALKFDLHKVGYMTAIPSIGRLIAGLFYGSLEQVLLKKYGVEKKYLRKGFICMSHLLPGTVLCMYLFNLLIEFGEGLAIGLLILATLGASAAVVTTSVNPQDLAPNFGGTQVGIMTFFGSLGGIVFPTILSKITATRNDLPQWSIMFGIFGGVYLFTGCMFIVFGSVSVQPWNEKKSEVQETPPIAE